MKGKRILNFPAAKYREEQTTYTKSKKTGKVSQTVSNSVVTCNRVFCISKKIEKHVLPYIDTYKKYTPPETVSMINTKEKINDYFYKVDIKNAYAKALYNENVITYKHYKELTNLPKHDRLLCLGMIATNKKIFHIETDINQRILNNTVEQLRKPTDCVFFFAQNIINRLCMDIHLTHNTFAYYVDAIYTNCISDAENIIRYLNQKGYDSKLQECNFKKISQNDLRIILNYICENKEKNIYFVTHKKLNI